MSCGLAFDVLAWLYFVSSTRHTPGIAYVLMQASRVLTYVLVCDVICAVSQAIRHSLDSLSPHLQPISVQTAQPWTCLSSGQDTPISLD